MRPAHYPDVAASRSPDGRIAGGPEEREHGSSDRGREVRDSGIVADVEAGAGEPAGQVPEVGNADGLGQRRVVVAGAPADGHGPRKAIGERLKLLERPVLFRAAGEGMDDREVLAGDVA